MYFSPSSNKIVWEFHLTNTMHCLLVLKEKKAFPGKKQVCMHVHTHTRTHRPHQPGMLIVIVRFTLWVSPPLSFSWRFTVYKYNTYNKDMVKMWLSWAQDGLKIVAVGTFCRAWVCMGHCECYWSIGDSKWVILIRSVLSDWVCCLVYKSIMTHNYDRRLL